MAHDGDALPLADLAATLWDARQLRSPIDARLCGAALTAPQAYRVQATLTALHLSAGRSIVGYKLGYTSTVMRRQMGIATPNYGPLFDNMIFASGDTVDGYMQPRLEPEVAVVLGRDLSGTGLLLHEVASAIGQTRCCLEIVDSVWRDYRFSAEQNTADGSSAAGVVMGPELGIDPLDSHRVTVSMTVDGEDVGTATGAAACGHPLRGLVWLCDQLAERGEGLRAGQVVITGGLTAAIPLNRGSRVEATYDRGVSVAVSRA
jgi:2-keto-4-pentenoate hydratase